jgi:putative transposase
VWLYHCFPLSLREIQEMMMARGVLVTYETIHQWCRKFGQTFANRLRRRRTRPGDKWHLDEIFIKIKGKTHYLWRAVDQDRLALDRRPNQHLASGQSTPHADLTTTTLS